MMECKRKDIGKGIIAIMEEKIKNPTLPIQPNMPDLIKLYSNYYNQ